MNVKVPEKVKRKLKVMYDLLGEVIHDSEPDFSQGELTFETIEDEFRFITFLSGLDAAIPVMKRLCYVADLTDDEVREACANNNVTVSSAINNMKHDIASGIIYFMLNQPLVDNGKGD